MDLRFVVIDRADVLDKESRKMLTSLLVNSGLDQAIVLATSEEAPLSVVPQGVKLVTLVERPRPYEAAVVSAPGVFLLDERARRRHPSCAR